MEYLISAVSGLLHSNQFFQGGILLGAMTWAFYQIKAVPAAILGKIRYWSTYTVHFDEVSHFYRQFSQWFGDKYPTKFRNVEVRLLLEEDEDNSFRTPRRNWQLRFTQFTDTNFIWYQNRLLWVAKSREKMEAARDTDNAYRNSYSVSGLFARKAITALCTEIFAQRIAEANSKGLRIATRNTWGNGWDIRLSPLCKSFDQLFFEDKHKVLDDIDKFTERKEFYTERRINYKRCYLFYGPGGTGKSSLAAALADHLGHDLYVISLATIKSDQALMSLAAEIPPKSTIVMEDIDCVLNQRDVKKEHVNFSSVLNFLDGPMAPTDCVLVMTTNHPETLDPALVRKGRVDFTLEINYPRASDAASFMTQFYGEPVKLQRTKRLDIPMSEVQEICMQHSAAEAVKLVETATVKQLKTRKVKACKTRS